MNDVDLSRAAYAMPIRTVEVFAFTGCALLRRKLIDDAVESYYIAPKR